jgi:hypothetical protein
MRPLLLYFIEYNRNNFFLYYYKYLFFPRFQNHGNRDLPLKIILHFDVSIKICIFIPVLRIKEINNVEKLYD